jgi:tetratricopeptide (TPR) repeat protein
MGFLDPPGLSTYIPQHPQQESVLMFNSIRRGWWTWIRQGDLKYHWLMCMAALTGAWAGAASAQTFPADSGRAAATAPATQPAEPAPELALQAIAQKRYAEAASILEPLAQDQSAGFDVLLNAGGAYDALALDVANDKTPAGRKSFQEYSQKAVAYYLRAAKLASEAGDPRAESVLQLLLRYDSRNPTALLSLARANRDRGQATRAIYYYRDYIKTAEGKGDYEAQIELGRLLVAEGFWRQAVDVLEKIQDVAGASANQQLALAYLAGKQEAKALAAADQAVDDPQHDADAFIVRSSLLLSLGEDSNPRQAVGDALTAAQLARGKVIENPADESVWQKAAIWQQKISSLADALRKLKPKTKTGEPDAAFHIRVAQLISDIGDLDRRLHDHAAVNVLSEAARSENTPVDLLVALAQRQRDLGQDAKARETADRILKQDANNAMAKQIIKPTGGKPEAK